MNNPPQHSFTVLRPFFAWCRAHISSTELGVLQYCINYTHAGYSVVFFHYACLVAGSVDNLAEVGQQTPDMAPLMCSSGCFLHFVPLIVLTQFMIVPRHEAGGGQERVASIVYVQRRRLSLPSLLSKSFCQKFPGYCRRYRKWALCSMTIT